MSCTTNNSIMWSWLMFILVGIQK